MYCIVLSLSFAAFFWISDIGFQRSIEATVNDASRTNLETIQRLLKRKAGLDNDQLQRELVDLSDVWANGALFEVADGNGNWIFRPARFTETYPALPAVRDHNIIFFTANLDYFEYRIALQRVVLAGKAFEIHAAVPTEPFDQALDHFRLIEKEALPLLVLLASLLGYWLSGWSLAPVKRIIETAESIGVQNLSRRLEVPKARDELRRLTETLNAMLARIEKSVTRITQFTADASHDLRTPVAVIRATAEITLRRRRTDAGYRDALTKILETSVETSELLENLLMLARADNSVAALEMKAIDLRNHVGKVKERAILLSADKGLRFTVRTPVEPVWVKADGIAIDRLLLILVDNAVKYSASGGQCEIELSRDGAKAQVAVHDWGIGISEIDLPSIFDRFVRADRTRSRATPGAGLGLAIAKWITEVHRGTITVESQVGVGSVFRVSLPIMAEEPHSIVLNEVQVEAPQI